MDKIKLHPHQLAMLEELKKGPKTIIFEIPARPMGQSFIALDREVLDAPVDRPLIIKPQRKKK